MQHESTTERYEPQPDADGPTGATDVPAATADNISPAGMTKMEFASAIEHLANAYRATSPQCPRMTVTVTGTNSAHVHSVQIDAGSLVPMVGNLSQGFARVVATVAIGGMFTHVVRVRASRAELEASLGTGDIGETYRIYTDGGAIFVWCATPELADATNPAAGVRAPDGWTLRMMFADAALALLALDSNSPTLPIDAAEITYQATYFDPDAWEPALPHAMARLLAQAHVPALRHLPLTWAALEWLDETVQKSNVDTKRCKIVRAAIAAAHCWAHLDTHERRAAFMGIERRWKALSRTVARQLDTREANDRFAKLSPVRLAFDTRSRVIVAVDEHYALDGWPTAETATKFAKLLRANAPTIHVVETEGGNGPEIRPLADAEASKTRLAGDAGARRVAGIPDIDVELYPVAFKRAGTRTDRTDGPRTLTVVRVPEPLAVETLTDSQELALLDPVGFLLKLFRELKTPFNTEDDVRRYAMMLAAPLLRAVCVGRLPAFLLVGGSGSGKGLSKYVAFLIWSLAAARGAPRDCHVSIDKIDGHEQNLQFANAGPRVFVSFTEAAKSNTLDLIVRLCERETVPGRAHHGNPIEVANTFVYVGDAVEGFSTKLETARRSIQIAMRATKHFDLEEGEGDSRTFVPTTFIKELAEVGPHLIEGLRRKIEAKGESFIVASSDDSGRAAATNALADLCGVSLDEVRGSPLTELFKMIADLVTGVRVDDYNSPVRASKQAAPAKGSRLAQQFKVYSPTAMLKDAARVSEHAELQRNLTHGTTVMKQIETEFGQMFVNLVATKCRVLVVHARDKFWVYAPGKDAFSFAPFDDVSSWVAHHLGPVAHRRLMAAKAAAMKHFDVPHEGVRVRQAVLDTLVPIVQYGNTPERTKAAFSAITQAHPTLEHQKFTDHAKLDVVERAILLVRYLQSECDLLADPTPANAERAGLVDCASDLTDEEVTKLRDDPSWDAFCTFRLLHPLAATAQRAFVVEAGKQAGLLLQVDDAHVLAFHGSTFHLHDVYDCGDATLEDIAAWSSANWHDEAVAA